MKTAFRILQLNDVDTIRMYSDRLDAGSILFTSDTHQVYVLNKANEVIEVVNTKGNMPPVARSQRPTNCKNCGAVLTSNKCEYCDTEY